jgi:hypothetical protein
VARAAGPRLRRRTAELVAGRTVDIADLSRVVVGRVVADLLGLKIGGPTDDDDAGYREVYDTGVRLTGLASGSTASAQLPAGTVATAAHH